ncbi:hypothetical protein RL3915 [Rhizobium johnstonii 3841]|uniref:Uncharacterized protein n=1 Tax=Rhizobium johnstonii (strain DSM 114642 / LMG 32736 / 3841) TaxID=216596 RepID=Q1MCC6_RHIJ3|nr:hypothetical protein RL3915 [Rhizobium johnstonii 3841]
MPDNPQSAQLHYEILYSCHRLEGHIVRVNSPWKPMIHTQRLVVDHASSLAEKYEMNCKILAPLQE